MSKKNQNDHIHKFKRLTYKSGNAIFFCATADCNKRMSLPLALGKRTICWRCGEPFLMSEYSIRLAKPHCENCHKPKIDKSSSDATEDSHVEETSLIPSDTPTSLATRLQQAIHLASKEVEDDI